MEEHLFVCSSRYSQSIYAKVQLTADGILCTADKGNCEIRNPLINKVPEPEESCHTGSIGNRQIWLNFESIIGCSCKQFSQLCNDSTNELYQQKLQNLEKAVALEVFAYPREQKPEEGKNVVKQKRARHSLCMAFANENRRKANVWEKVISNLQRGGVIQNISNLSNVPSPIKKRLLVLVNPHSGTGRACSILDDTVAPLLSEAGCVYKTIVTEFSGHARELATKVDLESFDSIIVISGDGLLFEVINGLMSRPDWKLAITTPLGVIPGGSGNALSCSLLHERGESVWEETVLHATFYIVKQPTPPKALDLMVVDLCTGRRLYSFLSVIWGIISDVDIESERFRFLGQARFNVGSLIRLISLRRYSGRLSYLPARETNLVENTNGEEKESFPILPILPHLDRPVPPEWVSYEGDFVTVGAVCPSHLGPDIQFVPESRLDDGLIHLCVVRWGISRRRIVDIISRMKNGTHIDGKDFEWLRVRAFRIEPIEPRGGIMTVDGERVEYGSIQAQVMPSCARLL